MPDVLMPDALMPDALMHEAPPLEAALREVEQVLFLEARLLDERRFRDWLGLFAGDCRYFVPARWGQADGLDEVSLFDDDHMTLETRVGRLEHPRAHAQLPPSRTVHALSNIRLLPGMDAAGLLVVQSVVQFTEFRAPDLTQLAGLQEHRLRREPGGLRIVAKRVDLLTCDQALRSLQIPI